MKEKQILDAISVRMGIARLNALQQAVLQAWPQGGDVVVYSPTGSGKTLAYAIPVLKSMREPCGRVQCVVVVPSRELAVQTADVLRAIAGDYKLTLCCGGHSVADEKLSLAVTPDVVVATPGRLLDHIKRGHVDVRNVRLLVLDEFDKSLELGFDDEMRSIVSRMPNLSRKLLTSATAALRIPPYLKLNGPLVVDRLDQAAELHQRLKAWAVRSPEPDKLATLRRLLLSLPEVGKTIVFVNYRDAAQRVCAYLAGHGVSAGVYNGALAQVEREKAVDLFNNGSYCVMVSTDLGSRGLDIDGVRHIIHYHLPVSAEAYTHRNGRTARVTASGDTYVLLGPGERLPGFVDADGDFAMPPQPLRQAVAPTMATLHFMAGRKEKISRGDVVGFIANNSDVAAAEIGRISLKDHCALAAVPAAKAAKAVTALNRCKIKGKRVRISIARVNGK